MSTLSPASPGQEHVPAWRDPARPVGERVQILLAEMTLEEKVAQLGSRWVGNVTPDTGDASGSPAVEVASTAEEALNAAPLQDVLAGTGTPVVGRCLVTPVDVSPVTRRVED